MKLIIDRNTWLRGDHDSALLRASDGKKCCLGFLGTACGLEDDQMRSHLTPASTNKELQNKWIEGVLEESTLSYGARNSSTIYGLMKFNDDLDIDDMEREQRLTDLFATIGVEVEFIN